MPRIEAPTVQAHRAMIFERLTDVAEKLLRQGSLPLTAGAVAEGAGIARNSIYRYVDSVDDFYGIVIARHLPRWLKSVDDALDGITDPRQRLLTWVRVNLEEASEAGHGWLMKVARQARISTKTAEGIEEAHNEIGDILNETWEALGSRHVEIHSSLTRAMLDAGFAHLDRGEKPSKVIDVVTAAVSALIDQVDAS